jgi:F-type H+-transporting ATPase subunit delta
MGRGATDDAALTRPARRYAEALFALAREKGQAAEVGADLIALRGVLEGDKTALRAIVDPKMGRAERKAAIGQKLLPGRHKLVKGLLEVLQARRREVLLPAVLRTFGEALERAEGLLRIAVQTATPLSPPALQAIEQKLGQATGRPLRLVSEVKPELLGGMRFLIDSTLIDASVRSRLERLEKKMLAARV